MRQISLLFVISTAFMWAGFASAQVDDEAAARAVMTEYMEAFSARDKARWADTLLFPHVRVASGSVVVNETREGFLENMDFAEFARKNDWSRSEWDSVELVQGDATKMHYQVSFTRYNGAGEPYATYQSLYVLQKVGGRWGIRARSSFAP